MTIRNPVEWGSDQFVGAVHLVGHAGRFFGRAGETLELRRPVVRHIALADLGDVLEKGFADFAANRTDVIFISLIYPFAGLILAQAALGNALLPLLFPLASGFALIGPFAATGLYEMSRRRELGEDSSWGAAAGVFKSPSFGAIFRLGLILMAVLLLWLGSAMAIYRATLGPQMPGSAAAFAADLFATKAGWALIVLGTGTGFLFALLVLSISVVSFPLLLDRRLRVSTAIMTSFRCVQRNPVPMLAWGAIVAGGLVLGSIPAFAGLIVVMPVLGHATWHLYRKAVG